MAAVYFLIGLGATIFGSLAGLGGGIIIKPVLDFLDDFDVGSITVLSASTVFTMACVSLISRARQESDVKINLRSSVTIAVGSVIGGVFGKSIFTYIMTLFENSEIVTVIQSFIIAVLMCVIYVFVKFKSKIKTFELSNMAMIIIIGFVLGVLAAFLGIGGGPLNVAVLALCFSMGAKESALNSIFIIFFSQLSALLLMAFTTGFSEFDLTMFPYMIAGGVLGGFSGSYVAKQVNDRVVDKIFSVGIVFIIFISVWNITGFYV